MIYFAKNPLPKKYKKVRQNPKKDLYILGSQNGIEDTTTQYNVISQVYLQNSSEEYTENSLDLEDIENKRPTETRYYLLGGKTPGQVFPPQCSECELTDYDCSSGQYLDLENCVCVDSSSSYGLSSFGQSYTFDYKTQSWTLNK